MRAFFGLEVSLPAVVAAEEDERLLIQLELFQKLHDLPELAVDHVHERGIDTGIAIGLLPRVPRFVLEQLPRGIVVVDSPKPVWRCPGQVAEEGFVSVRLNEAEGFLKDLDLGMGVALVEAQAIIASEWHFFAVSN